MSFYIGSGRDKYEDGAPSFGDGAPVGYPSQQTNGNVPSRETANADLEDFVPSVLPLWYLPESFCDRKHGDTRESVVPPEAKTWRMNDRMKTHSILLTLCLNLGIDPPDANRIEPCGRTEAWIDLHERYETRPHGAAYKPPLQDARQELEAVGSNLQRQYDRLQKKKMRYKVCYDPTVDEIKKNAIALRRASRDDRILFHYNGHGVPMNTTKSEIWVFNKSYTQYIPMSLADLVEWVGTPAIYVFDCNRAGAIVDHITNIIQEGVPENGEQENSSEALNLQKTIMFAACESDQSLPMNTELPADLFTTCMTSPIKAAFHWFVVKSVHDKLVQDITLESVAVIPGSSVDRRTMLGQVSWIFTAVTDTIAWNVLPRRLFQILFRQDLLVASMSRNYLLAMRIMSYYGAQPVSHPYVSKEILSHRMWSVWDYVLERYVMDLQRVSQHKQDPSTEEMYFFLDQLTCFEMWLKNSSQDSRPAELPIVLQALLSQSLRLRALKLLAKFTDIGIWAVKETLAVGIYAYILKLLQSTDTNLRPHLVLIWSKILAVDESCQVDMIKDGGHRFFIDMLKDQTQTLEVHTKTEACFTLARLVSNYQMGQEVCVESGLQEVLLSTLQCCEEALLSDCSPSSIGCITNGLNEAWKLHQWCLITLGKLWEKSHVAKWKGVRDLAHEKVYFFLRHEHVEVRAAAVFSLGLFITGSVNVTEHALTLDHSVALKLCDCEADGSPMVRQEVVVALAYLVKQKPLQFSSIAKVTFEEDQKLASTITGSSSPSSILSDGSDPEPFSGMPEGRRNLSLLSFSGVGEGIKSGRKPFQSSYTRIWATLRRMAGDSFIKVSDMAWSVIESVLRKSSAVPDALTVHTLSSSVRSSHHHTSTDAPGRATSDGVGMESCIEIPETDVGEDASLLHTARFNPRRSLRDPGPGQPPSASNVEELVPGRQLASRESSTVSNSSPINVCGRVAPVEIAVPDTGFYVWCGGEFALSSRKESPLDLLSKTNKVKIQNHSMKLEVRMSASKEHVVAGETSLSEHTMSIRCQGAPTLVKFLPFSPNLLVSDGRSVQLYDYTDGNLKCTVPELDPPGLTYVSAIEVVNSCENTMALVATDNGVVRVWKHLVDPHQPVLISSWNILTAADLNFKKKGDPVILSWEEQSQLLAASSPSLQVIHMWDAEREMIVQSLQLPGSAEVTSLTTDSLRPHYVVASTKGGSLCLFDRRIRQDTYLPSEGSSLVLKDHYAPIIGCHFENEVEGKLISACGDGAVKVWDLRNRKPVCDAQFSVGKALSHFCYHSQAKIFALAHSRDCRVTIVNGAFEKLNSVSHPDGPSGSKYQRKLLCMDFHPHWVKFCSGYSDGCLSIHSIPQSAASR